MIDDKCIEEIIHKYFKQNNVLVDHQIESYNDYIDNILPQILSQVFPLSINIHNKELSIHNVILNISEIKIDKPYYTENNGCSNIMTPSIARLRNYTYSLSIYIDFLLCLIFVCIFYDFASNF